MSNKWKHFFSKRNVRQTFAFPSSCFTNIFQNNSFSIQSRLRDKLRVFVFQGKSYDDFLDSVNFIDFLSRRISCEYYVNRNNSKFISFTDIYSNNNLINKIINGKKSYSSTMYEMWDNFINMLRLEGNIYKCCYYVDIENFYRNIYPHYISGLNCKDIEQFRKIKDILSDDYKAYIKTNNWLYLYQKQLIKKVCKCQETCGLPIGNGLSDFCAEQMLQQIEHFINLSTININFKLIRYRDDMYIFTNTKAEAEELFNILGKILLDFDLHINKNKSKLCVGKISQFIDVKSYHNEKEFVNNLKKENVNSDSVLQFVKSFPESNKVNTLLKKIYENENDDNNLLLNLIQIANSSRTSVIPWIIAILDKKLTINQYDTFVNNIEYYRLSDNDQVWLWCYEQKYEITSVISERLNNFVKEFDFIQNFNKENINFGVDADVFHY